MSQEITFNCPSCGSHQITVPAHLAGARHKCGACNTEVTVPGGGGAAPGSPPQSGEAAPPRARTENVWVSFSKVVFHLTYVVAIISVPVNCFRNLGKGLGAGGAAFGSFVEIISLGWGAALVLFLIGKIKR